MKRIASLLGALALGAALQAQVPDLALSDLSGRRVEFRDLLADGPLLVSFWATWCHPCQEEMKALQPLHEAYGGLGLTVAAVSIDDAKTTGKVKALVKGKRYTFTVLLDPEMAAMKAFGLLEVPGVFLLARDGTRLYEHSGYKPGDEIALEQAVKAALRPSQPACDSTGAGR
ncbi:MAG: TlpA family protein disulfide reductase [Candidatus Edwardsbacteria bacterium]|jgi:peroxiredoxin|nr:TlpA family protein disulfide reductase [Candidatus Edwardsbacteria bacterium]